MKNMIKNGWRDVTINEYIDLCNIINDNGQTEYNREVAKIALLANMDEEQVWSLNINQFRNYQVQFLWTNEFKINEKVMFKTISINGQKYEVDPNLQNFTVAQYIDFQTFYPQLKKDNTIIGNILACFIIPDGKKYAEGYDIKELVNTINNHLDIMTAQEILFFFLKNYLISIRVLANYFNWIVKRKTRKLKDKTQAEKMTIQWENTKQNILDGLNWLTKLDN